MLPKYRPYEQEQVATEIRSGTATFGASYRFEWAPGRHRFELSDLGLALRNVTVAERGAAGSRGGTADPGYQGREGRSAGALAGDWAPSPPRGASSGWRGGRTAA